MSDQIIVSESMLDALKATRPWVKFLAILGFVFTGLILLAGLIMFAGFSAVSAKSGMPAGFGPLFGIIYLAMAIFFYLIPCLFLLRYARAIARIPADGRTALEDALGQQKSFWKYMGIFALIVIVLYVLLFFGAIAFGVMAGLGHHS